MNSTVDGQITAHYIADQLGYIDVELSFLVQGVPFGGEQDYIDDGTFTSVLAARKSL